MIEAFSDGQLTDLPVGLFARVAQFTHLPENGKSFPRCLHCPDGGERGAHRVGVRIVGIIDHANALIF